MCKLQYTYTVYYAWYTMHCTLCIVQCTLYIVHCTLYILPTDTPQYFIITSHPINTLRYYHMHYAAL